MYLFIYTTYQGGNSASVTILAADGSRHILGHYNQILQLLGLTLSGLGGSQNLRGGLEFSGASTKGMYPCITYTHFCLFWLCIFRVF